ncbi:hypothetical protein BC830DRAFT_1163829 [Chytriomyces sp. MP71]|nr:hypothetical protein BC830DRAFT_1163829 [Chytriomyces sp. MP71]
MSSVIVTSQEGGISVDALTGLGIFGVDASLSMTPTSASPGGGGGTGGGARETRVSDSESSHSMKTKSPSILGVVEADSMGLPLHLSLSQNENLALRRAHSASRIHSARSSQKMKRLYKSRAYDHDLRDWLPSFEPLSTTLTSPGSPASPYSPTKLPASTTPLPRVASSAVSLFRLGDVHLEGTAAALAIDSPAAVPRIMYDKGISPWAAVMAVGSGLSTTPVLGQLVEDNLNGRAMSVDGLQRAEIGKDAPVSLRPLSLMERRRIGMPLEGGKESDATAIHLEDEDEKMAKRNFIIKLARNFHAYGAPSHRLEHHMALVSEALHVEARFFVLPNLILISFGGETAASTTHFVKISNGQNMAKLAQVNALCLTLTEGLIDIHSASDLLEGVRAGSDYPWWMVWITFPVQAFTFATLVFQTGWLEAVVATALGIMTGGMSALADKYNNSFGYMLEFFASIVATFLARAAQGAFYSHGICFDYVKVTLSALVVFLPGMSLTISIIELSTRNVISGVVRMFAALFVAVLIGFGMAIGGSLVLWDASLVRDTCAPVSPLWAFLLFIPMSMAINILFQGSKHQWPIMILASALGFVSSQLLNTLPALHAQPTAVNAVASTVIGLASNLYARATNDVAVAPILVSVWIQVPGSLSVKSMLGFFVGSGGNATAAVGASSGVVDGSNFVFQMLNIALSLAM